MSRELDARVAEAMGGQVRWREHEPVYAAPHACSVCMASATPVPHFSTDPAACEELRKECRRRGWCYEEAWYAAADGSDAEFWTWVNDFDLHHVSEVSQEEAFCLAFLAAVGAEKGAGNGK